MKLFAPDLREETLNTVQQRVLYRTSEALSLLDMLCSLAHVSFMQNYTRVCLALLDLCHAFPLIEGGGGLDSA